MLLSEAAEIFYFLCFQTLEAAAAVHRGTAEAAGESGQVGKRER